MKRTGPFVIPTLIEEKRYLLAWIEERLSNRFTEAKSYPIGIVRDKKIVAVWVYENWRPPNIFISVAADTPRWCSRHVLKALLGIAF